MVDIDVSLSWHLRSKREFSCKPHRNAFILTNEMQIFAKEIVTASKLTHTYYLSFRRQTVNEADDIDPKNARQAENGQLADQSQESDVAADLVHHGNQSVHADESAHCTGMSHHQVICILIVSLNRSMHPTDSNNHQFYLCHVTLKQASSM